MMMLVAAIASIGRMIERHRVSPGGLCARMAKWPSSGPKNQSPAPISEKKPMRCDASRRRSGGSERGRPCESLDAGVDGGGGTIRRVADIAVDTTQKSADRLANAPLSRAWRNEQRASCISTPFTEMSMMPERRGPNGADPDGAAPE